MACKWPVVIHKLLPMFPNTMNYSQTTSLFPNTRNSYKLLPHSRTQRNKHKLRPCFQTQGIITNYFLVPKHKEFSQTTSLFANTMNNYKQRSCFQTQGIITNYFLVPKHKEFSQTTSLFPNTMNYHKLRSCFQNTRNNSQPSPQFPIHGRCHTTWRTRQKPPKFAWLLAW